MPATATFNLACLTGDLEVALTTIPDCIYEGIHFWKTGGKSVSAADSLISQRVLNVLVWISDVSIDKLQDNRIYDIPIV